MKKRRGLKVLFSLILTISVSIGLCSTAFANELYPPYSLIWSTATASSVHIDWSVSGTLPTCVSNNLEAGIQYWDAPFSSLTTTKYSTVKGGEGTIVFAATGEAWWSVNISDDTTNAAAETFSFNANDTRITANNVKYANGKIVHSIIYFSPYSLPFAGMADVSAKCLVAHEMGHALGFGHRDPNDVASIMKTSPKYYTSLPAQDRLDFNTKYYTNLINGNIEKEETE